MVTTTLTSNGRATIPKVIRQLLGIKPGGKITFEVRNHEVVLCAAHNPAGMLAAYAKTRPARAVRASVAAYLGANDKKSRAR